MEGEHFLYTMDAITRLVAAIKAVTDDPTVVPSDYLSNGSHDELPKSVQAVIAIAEEALICDDGNPNFKAHRELRAEGFPVYAGETDSFGWLTGVILTPKGQIVYG